MLVAAVRVPLHSCLRASLRPCLRAALPAYSSVRLGLAAPRWYAAAAVAPKQHRKPPPPPAAKPAPKAAPAPAPTPTPDPPLPILESPAVARWLLFSSTLVFAVIVVGGVTRLTESGLSITEWRPLTGILPPLSAAAWEEEFTKYKDTPEFKLLNHGIALDDFKRIFYMEWAHRVLGRVVGLAFVGPLAYFAARRRLAPRAAARLAGLALLIAAQGALGWHMVRSGLAPALLDTPGAVPRVSQYRLAAHLALALALYAGMFAAGIAAIKDWKYAHGAPLDARALAHPAVRRFRAAAAALTGLVLLTALSGAFVAGLDAGLVYNEFPLMGGRLAPPLAELLSPAYARRADGRDLWRNAFENPATVQLAHRALALTTYALLTALFVASRRAAALPPRVRTAAAAAYAAANVQVALGVATLVWLVPVPLAAAHQAGSVVLLSAMVHLLVVLRRPGAAAQAWRAHFARVAAARKGARAAA